MADQKRRGVRMLRRALPYIDGRSESQWESVLRLFHVTCGVAVEPQHRVCAADGGFIARGDLWLLGTRSLHEYDGAVHRDSRQHRADLLRDRRLVDAGWTRRGYTSKDLLHQPLGILRDADAATGRAHRAARVRRWYGLLGGSMFTPPGQARVMTLRGTAPEALSA